MDKREETIEIFSLLESNLNDDYVYADVLNKIILYFEKMCRYQNLTSQDLEVLRIIALKIQVPTLFKIVINKLSNQLPLLSFDNVSSILKESRYYISTDKMLHKYQISFLQSILRKENFRYFFTAPTTFGKTFLVKELIKLTNYTNILLVFPSIALISESIASFYEIKEYSSIKNKYKIITLIQEDDISLYENKEPKLFILTVERYLTLINLLDIEFDFVFIDEVYKLDDNLSNEQSIHDDSNNLNYYEMGRELTYRFSINNILKNTKNILIAGPYLNINSDTNNSFQTFLNVNKFSIIDYNMIEIVNKNNISVNTNTTSKKYSINIDGNEYLLNGRGKKQKFIQLINILKDESTLVYHCTIRGINEYAKYIIDNTNVILQSKELKKFILHLENRFNQEWYLIKCLKRGVGLHHGRLPKYIQKEILYLFNNHHLNILISTTTIIEGVNTVAKNMIILSHRKGNKKLNKFDSLNIVGRSGRFTEHFSGRCFFMDSEFEQILNGDDKVLTHNNYSTQIDKTNVDLFLSDPKYLSDLQKDMKKNLINSAREQCFNYKDILEIYPSIDFELKVELAKKIKVNFDHYQDLVFNVNKNLNKRFVRVYDMNNFLKFFESILKKTRINNYLRVLPKNQNYLLSVKINGYLINGLEGMINRDIDFKKEQNKKINIQEINRIINDDLVLVNNIFRFELPRFLGLLDKLNEYIHSQFYGKSVINFNKSFEEMLEYDAKSKDGKLAFDYGTPFNVIKKIENNDVDLDEYEQSKYNDINRILFNK